MALFFHKDTDIKRLVDTDTDTDLMALFFHKDTDIKRLVDTDTDTDIKRLVESVEWNGGMEYWNDL